MLENNQLLKQITCCFGPCPEPTLSSFDLLMFTLGSFIIISMLLLYHSKIPKSSIPKSELDNPIYQSKDILLQTNNLEANFIVAEKTTSTFTKTLVYIIIAIVIFTPLYQLLGVEYFI
jgi:hypothetical protein